MDRQVTVTSADERFLQLALDIMEIHRSDANFNADAFIREIGIESYPVTPKDEGTH